MLPVPPLPDDRSNIPRLLRQSGVETLMGDYLALLMTQLAVPTHDMGKKV